MACCAAIFDSRYFPCLKRVISRAFFSSGTTITSSPAFGVPESPSTSKGVDGPAETIFLPLSLTNPLIRPNSCPLIMISPFLSVPLCTRIVAIGPRPLSNRDSITTPEAGPVSIAFNSSISDCNKTLPNNVSIPSPVRAETWTKIVSPPHSSGITS